MIKREIWLSTYRQVNFEICKTYSETDEAFPKTMDKCDFNGGIKTAIEV